MTARGTPSRADRALAPAVVAAAALALVAVTSLRPDSGPPDTAAVGPSPFVNPLDVLLADLTGLVTFLFVESVWGSFLIAVLGVVGYALAAERTTSDESPTAGPSGERAAAARAAYVDGEIGLAGLERRLAAVIAADGEGDAGDGDADPVGATDPAAESDPVAVIGRSADELVVSDPATGEVLRTVRLPGSGAPAETADDPGGPTDPAEQGDPDAVDGIELRLR